MKRKVELLEILAEGCRVHPAYRARRAATQKCKPCVVVWEARCELKLRDAGNFPMQLETP